MRQLVAKQECSSMGNSISFDANNIDHGCLEATLRGELSTFAGYIVFDETNKNVD